jgi:DNA-binding LacI/PurR family transcriptional regulator
MPKAEEFLARFAAGHSAGAAVSVAGLAAKAGVSYGTMWKAVRRAKDAGRLHGGYRLAAGPAISSGSAPVMPVQPKARLVERMAADLLSGSIVRGGRIASVKELAARYGAAARTIRFASEHLRRQGLLYAHGRHYECMPAVHHRNIRIVLIAYTYAQGTIILPDQETGFLRSCEITCVNSNALLEVVVVRNRGEGLQLADITGTQHIDLPTGEEVAGYIYMLHTAEAFGDAIMRTLLATRKPVAVLDQAGVFPADRKEYDIARVRIFTASAREQPGKLMARYLLAKGHRHIAYISPYHADPWSQNRCMGMRQVVDLAGKGCSLMEFTIPKSAKTGEYQQQARADSRSGIFENQFARWQKQAPRVYHEDLDALRIGGFQMLYMSMGTRAAAYSLLDKAVKDRTISAWAMSSDYSAAMAWDYCRKKGIAVPGMVAIVGFDDLPSASTLRITSYNFNFDAVASIIIHFLLQPAGAYWSKHRVVEIQGKIMERGTA